MKWPVKRDGLMALSGDESFDEKPLKTQARLENQLERTLET